MFLNLSVTKMVRYLVIERPISWVQKYEAALRDGWKTMIAEKQTETVIQSAEEQKNKQQHPGW